MGKTWVFGLAMGLVALVAACSSGSGESTTAINVEAFEYPMVSSDAAAGQEVYATFCEGCHPNGMEGDGPAIVGEMLTPAQMRWRVRSGEGDMPGFDTSKISKTELDNLLAYTATFQAVNLGQ
ncbi:MAG: cytochrome c [Myxococcota bacterium]